MGRGNLLLSPLFSTKNQPGGFFRNFTPKNVMLTPTFDIPQGLGYDNSQHYSALDVEIPQKMDRLVDNLKMEIKNRIAFGHSGSNGFQGGGLNLDIDLINDTYGNELITKSPHNQTPLNRIMDLATTRKFGELLPSPNSSFLQRKK